MESQNSLIGPNPHIVTDLDRLRHIAIPARRQDRMPARNDACTGGDQDTTPNTESATSTKNNKLSDINIVAKRNVFWVINNQRHAQPDIYPASFGFFQDAATTKMIENLTEPISMRQESHYNSKTHCFLCYLLEQISIAFRLIASCLLTSGCRSFNFLKFWRKSPMSGRCFFLPEESSIFVLNPTV